MIVFTCKCGTHFQVTEEGLFKKQSQSCPECGGIIPNDIFVSIKSLITVNTKHKPFKACLIESKEIIGVITGPKSI